MSDTDKKQKVKQLLGKVTKVILKPTTDDSTNGDTVAEAVLSLSQRLKRRQIMRRSKAKIQMGSRRALRQHGTASTMKRRSRRVAIRLMRKKLLKNRNYQDLPLAARAQIDRIIARRKSAIVRLATRIEPRLRAAENRRKLGSKFASTAQVMRPQGQKTDSKQVTAENYREVVNTIVEGLKKESVVSVPKQHRLGLIEAVQKALR